MSEEQKETTKTDVKDDNIDITKAAEDLANEKLENQNKKVHNDKVSELEAKLQEYQAKEAEELKKQEAETKKAEIEALKNELKSDFDEKLAKLSTRQTSGKVKDYKEVLSEEDYEKDKVKHLDMLANHIIENGKL